MSQTNSSRKKRKLAVDPLESESEEANRTPREVDDKDVDSHREDFPKGKRKARKRRLLALQGRSLRAGKCQKQDALSEGEAGSSSPSSDDDGAQGAFSDEGSEGAGPYAAREEYTSSSDDSD